MTRRPERILAMAFVLALVPAPVFAKDATPKPSTPAVTSDALGTLDSWLAASRIYKTAVAAREAAVQAINETFVATVKAARIAYEAADVKGATAAAKYAANAKYSDAVNTAAQARAQARAALPPLPPPPGPRPTTKASVSSSASARPTR